MTVLHDTSEALKHAERVMGYQRDMPRGGPRWPDTIGWVFDRVQAIFRTLRSETGPLRAVDAELSRWFTELSKHPDHLEMQRVVRVSEVHREDYNRVITPRFAVGNGFFIPTVTATQEGPNPFGRPLRVYVAHFDETDNPGADWVFAPGTRWERRVVLDALQELVDRWNTEWLPEGQRLSERPHNQLMEKAAILEAPQ